MVTTETWMGSGQSVTLAPESELFLGFMPYGPTLGRTKTNKAHLIKYSLGYAVDGASVLIENAHGQGTNAVKHFTDYYHLVPDLYTGCTAKFFHTNASGTAATLQFSAVVAGNDADAIYFSGNLLDYPNLYADTDAVVGTGRERGYIILEANGSVIPAPISLEKRNSTSASELETGDTEITVSSGTDGSIESLNVDDLLYTSSGQLIGKIYGFSVDATALTTQDVHSGLSTDDTIHILSGSLDTLAVASTEANGIGSITTPNSQTGILTAGDYISNHASARASVTILGKVIYVSADGKTITYAQSGSATASIGDEIYKGRKIATISATTHIYTVSPRILSNNWIGLTNSVQTPTVEVETKQMNLALAGTRNFSYQYRGMETAGAASIDVNLNHGSWLYYAFGGLTSASSSVVDTNPADNHFESTGSAASAHEVYAGYTTGVDRDYDSHAQNGKLHRVLKGTNAICPPLLPLTGMAKLALPSDNGTTGIQNAITYTFSEKNDNKLPSFALELLTQKGSALDGTGKSLMVDRNTYSESVYAQIYPGCVVSDMTLTANENEELKASINLNVKRVFEAESGYVGKCYDATNNDTSEFKNLLNFGQQTGSNANITQSFIDPFFFSNGSITLFGQEFLKVSSFTLSLQNTLTDKRYIGQYNRQIKDYTPGQRTYEISISALVTDRRLFDELRRLSPHRFDLGEAADGSNAKIQLVFTKPNGESIRLEFDDYLVSASTWPIQDDRGPIQVDFTIMPLRTGTLNTVTHWVLQS
jgi:hypothetical protein